MRLQSHELLHPVKYKQLPTYLLAAIELGLELKFVSSGLELIPEISPIQDVDVLRSIQEGLRTINNLDELREIYRVSEA